MKVCADKSCGKEFHPFDTIQKYCSYVCYNRNHGKKVTKKQKSQPSERIQAKRRTKARDSYRCMLYGVVHHGRHESTMDSHHIIYLSEGGVDEDWNLITLCSYCHHHVAHRDKAWQPRLLRIVGGLNWYENIDKSNLSQGVLRKLEYCRKILAENDTRSDNIVLL